MGHLVGQGKEGIRRGAPNTKGQFQSHMQTYKHRSTIYMEFKWSQYVEETMSQQDILCHQVACYLGAKNRLCHVESLVKGVPIEPSNITGYFKSYWLLSIKWQKNP